MLNVMDGTDEGLTRKELRELHEQRQQPLSVPASLPASPRDASGAATPGVAAPGRTRRWRPLVATISIVAAVALVAWYFTTSGVNAPPAPSAAVVEEPAQVFGMDEVVPFPTNAAGGPLSVAVIGDSLAGNMYKALMENRTENVTPVDISFGGCGIFDAEQARADDGFIAYSEALCWSWKDKLRAADAQQPIDVYILHNLWNANDQLYEGQRVTGCSDVWAERYTAQLELLISIGAEQQHEPLILLSNDRGIEGNVLLNSERLTCKTAAEDAVIASHGNVKRLDLEGTLCPDGVCAMQVPSGAALYSDGTHFGPEGLALLAPWLQNEMAKAIAARDATP